MFVPDTNVFREYFRASPHYQRNPGVVSWFEETDRKGLEIYLSVITLAEMYYGGEKLLRKDPEQAGNILSMVDQIRAVYAENILQVDEKVARIWARMLVVDATNPRDSLLAATAKAHDFTVVSRNEKHIKPLGVKLINPFS